MLGQDGKRLNRYFLDRFNFPGLFAVLAASDSMLAFAIF